MSAGVIAATLLPVTARGAKREQHPVPKSERRAVRCDQTISRKCGSALFLEDHVLAEYGIVLLEFDPLTGVGLVLAGLCR